MTDLPVLSRRAFANIVGTVAGLAAAAPALAASKRNQKGGHARHGTAAAGLNGPFVDLLSPMGNVEAMARIQGDVNPKATSHSWYFGRVTGQRPGEVARDLMGIIGMGTVRMLPLQGRPGYLMLRKELGYFVDLKTRAVLDTWRNPYSDEEVTVDHIANPSINAEIKPYSGDNGLYEEIARKSAKPFVLDWSLVGGRVITEQHANLWVKNPLDPAVWQRESSGPMIAISDSNTFNVAAADLQNPALTKVPSKGHWVHQRPWQPWMLMGQADGFISYNCSTGSAASLADLPQEIVALARERHPDFLIAPTEVTKPESSLARYMRTRKPAPPKASGQ